MNDEPYRLIVTGGLNIGFVYNLSEEETIGRSGSNSIVLPSPEISRRHARISWQGDSYYLEDLGSTNGTFVNRKRLTSRVILTEGDQIQIGDIFQLRFTTADGIVESDLEAEDEAAVQIATIANDKSPDEQLASPQPEIPTPKPPLVSSLDDESVWSSQSALGDRGRQLLLWCGCFPLLLISICLLLFIFLDAYQQGRLLYCGSLSPFFELLLGPFGFNPVCP